MVPTPLPLADLLGHEASDKRIDILRRIGEVGSISEAARGAGVSYKAAWQAIETLTNLAGQPLVAKVVGGNGGGGAALTPAGEQVLRAAHAMSHARQLVLQQLSEGFALPRPAVLAMRTSMRNQFPCTVGSLKSVQSQVRVALHLPGAQQLHARITRVSAQLLDLKPGLDVLIMCKATAVTMAPDSFGLPEANALAGRISRVGKGDRSELALELPGGIQLVGFPMDGFSPRTGQAAVAAIEESGLVIGAIP